uniref:Uncharacterized protein n=1 Tax=Tanacetum cinerariifolium TaxID=118510 RepID=A0A6L2KSE3_TANCI|nr:hypothetical protein [Tanacetum cinerariifolium]
MKWREEHTKKFEECKAIFMEDGSPLYTPLYYSREEIEYFSANSGFSDDEKQETEREEANEAITTVNINIMPDIIPTHEKEKQNGVKKTNEEPKRRHWCEAISQEKEGVRHYWASCNPYYDECDGGGLPDNMEKHYWKSNNDRERVDLEWEELSFDNLVRIKFGREGEDVYDSVECGEDKSNTILETVHDKLDDDWFIGETSTKVKLLGIDEIPRTMDNMAAIRAELLKEIGTEGRSRKNVEWARV